MASPAAQKILDALNDSPQIMWEVCRGLNDDEPIGPWEALGSGEQMREDFSGDAIGLVYKKGHKWFWTVYDEIGGVAKDGVADTEVDAKHLADEAILNEYPESRIVGMPDFIRRQHWQQKLSEVNLARLKLLAKQAGLGTDLALRTPKAHIIDTILDAGLYREVMELAG